MASKRRRQRKIVGAFLPPFQGVLVQQRDLGAAYHLLFQKQSLSPPPFKLAPRQQPGARSDGPAMCDAYGVDPVVTIDVTCTFQAFYVAPMNALGCTVRVPLDIGSESVSFHAEQVSGGGKSSACCLCNVLSLSTFHRSSDTKTRSALASVAAVNTQPFSLLSTLLSTLPRGSRAFFFFFCRFVQKIGHRPCMITSMVITQPCYC